MDTQLKERFLSFAKALWTSPFADQFSGELEQGYLMLAWWQCQHDQTTNQFIQKDAKNILIDEEKMFDFNEMCNRNNLTLKQVRQFFDEIFPEEESDEIEDMYDGLTTEELNGQR